MTIVETINAAIDGKDYRTAAVAILAHPASRAFPREQLEPIGRVAFGRRFEAKDAAWHVIFAADLLARLEADHAGHR